MTVDKAHCFFEQSGTFKREFIKLGIPAEDYDIQNNFGETDHTDDLFAEIEKAHRGGASLFDEIKPEDIIMAFFPCIKFCNIAEYNQRCAQERWRRMGVPIQEIYSRLKRYAEERHFFYMTALKMHEVVETRGLRMIMENPWNTTNATNFFWFRKPTIVDWDRTRRGDRFVKQTAYWFTGCEPTSGESYQQTPDEMRMVTGIGNWSKRPATRPKAAGSNETGLCSEERSMISPDYARNFICDFVLGKRQAHTNPEQLTLFSDNPGAK